VDQRFDGAELRRLVDAESVISPIERDEFFKNAVESRLGITARRVGRVADDADLPQNEGRCDVDRFIVVKKLSRLERLKAVGSRIEAEVGDHAGVGGYAGQHPRIVILFPRPLDSQMARLWCINRAEDRLRPLCLC
jgi:hypothetical protein